MARKLMGKKRGMIQLFDEKGGSLACTVIEIQPNVITQIKTIENDGYNAIQFGYEVATANDPRTVERRIGKPLMGHYKKASVEPRKHLSEIRVDSVDEYTLGQEMTVDLFGEVKFIDVVAKSKGKGYQGVMKRHNYAGGPASHGSGFHRHKGSTGMRSTPGRCLPGGGFAGHMGDEWVTVQSLKVVLVDSEKGVLVIEGSVPGARDGLVYVSEAVKMKSNKAR